MKGTAEMLMYIPPIAPVNRPAHGPARHPLKKIGSCERWILDTNGPRTIGIAKGSTDSTFVKAANRADMTKILVFMIDVHQKKY